MTQDNFSPSRVTWELTLQKMVGTTHTSGFTLILMSLVHSASFSLVRQKNFLYYESPYNSTTKVASYSWNRRFYDGFGIGGHSPSLRPVRPMTSFLRHEWRKNVTLQKVPETTYASSFTMIFMSFLHSASLSLVRRPTSILRYEWR